MPFAIEDAPSKDKVRLVRSSEPLFDTEEKLFALPDSLDEEKGPYADFLDHITKLRVKMLNDQISFEQRLTVEEIEDQIRENQHNDYMEGKATHVFTEITDILEYVPEGYEHELGEEEKVVVPEDEHALADQFPDIEEETLEEDETMRWEEDDDPKPGEGDQAGDERLEGLGDEDDLDNDFDDEDSEEDDYTDDDEEEDIKPKSKSKAKPKPSPKPSKRKKK